MSSWETVVAQPDQLGESPFWHPQERMLYWVDIQARQIRRVDPRQGRVESWAVPSEPGCIAPAAGGGLVMGLRDGIYRARSWGSPLECLVRMSYEVTTTRFNDGKADPVGRFWAGTMYEPRDARKAQLYSVDLRAANGNGGAPLVQIKAGDAVIANGLAWSPDATTVYWADTANHIIHAWEWEGQANVMSHRRVFQQFPGKPPGWTPGQPGYGGRPDGATVDSAGNYWCAMYEGGRVLQFAPSGQLLAEIAVPVRCPTMPCFGGDDLKTLFVTTARHSRSPQELQEQPQAGCVFATRVDVAGLPVNSVSD
jgi:sugar lactone lactonase YvrE